MAFFDNAIGLLVFILGFGFIVFVHELGHFLVAKWVGVRVEQFAVGMGHAMVSFRKGLGFRVGATQREMDRRVRQYLENIKELPVPCELDDKTPSQDVESITPQQYDRALHELGIGETEYRLAWAPIGGYVKMLGQDDMDPEHRSTDPRSYNNKPVWARMCVISAGVVMNIIFGLIFFVTAFMFGVELTAPVVGDVAKGESAATVYATGHDGDPKYQGLKSGDEFVTIDGEDVLDFTDVLQAAALSSPDTPIDLVVRRRDEKTGREELLTFSLIAKKLEDQPFARFGIAYASSLQLGSEQEMVTPKLLEAGVKPNMRVIVVNGDELISYHQFKQRIIDAQGRAIDVTFQDPKSKETVMATVSGAASLMTGADPQDPRNLLGMVPHLSLTEVKEKTPAEKAGLKDDDIVVRVNQTDWPTNGQFRQAIQAVNDQTPTVAVLRDGKIVEVGEIKPGNDGLIGVAMQLPGDSAAMIGQTLAHGAVRQINDLVSGSLINRINGQPVNTFGDMQRELIHAKEAAANESQTPLKELRLTIDYQPAVKGATAQTAQIVLNQDDIDRLGNATWLTPIDFIPLKQLVKTNDPLVAAKLGFTKTRQTMIQVYMTLVGIASQRIQAKEMRGPVGIVHVGTVIVRDHSPTFFLFFLGLISINLAVINFLPIPVVDGGHMVFLLIEKLKGSPVSVQVQAMATYAGLAMILCVFLFTIYHDLGRLINGG